MIYVCFICLCKIYVLTPFPRSNIISLCFKGAIERGGVPAGLLKPEPRLQGSSGVQSSAQQGGMIELQVLIEIPLNVWYVRCREANTWPKHLCDLLASFSWYSYYSGFHKCVISVLKLWGTAPTRSAWNRASSGWPVHGKAGFDDMWGKQSIIVGSSSTSNHQWCQQQIRLGGAGQNAPHRHTWLHEVRTAEHGRDQSGCWLGKGTAQFERWAQQLANKVWFLAQWQFLEFFDIL